MSTSTPFARARNDQQRQERREAILAVAARMLTRMRVSELSLNELAREVGLAKSNVLRYFESREAVLLELYDREYRDWLDALDERMRPLAVTTPGSTNATTADIASDASAVAQSIRIEGIAAAVADTVAERPVFCDLAASAAGVLEHNVSATVAADYKRSAIANSRRLAELIGPLVGGLSELAAITLVGGVNVVVGGVWAMSQPSPGMAAAYAEHPDLRAMRLDLRVAVRELVATLLVGLRHRTPQLDESVADTASHG
jgi:AcrR family transcriptional regulator